MTKHNLNYYSLVCSRDSDYSGTTKNLFKYFSDAGVKVKSLVGQPSIFTAYDKGVNSLKDARSNDIVILCHDDIDILTPADRFKFILDENLKEDIGFVGVAGTSKLNADGIWWDWNDPQHMSGEVIHGSYRDSHTTNFGPYKEVAVLDGVFLAARVSTLKKLDLIKPGAFEGGWDFYDITYCLQALKLGFVNLTVPIKLRHESPGAVTGRESWHKNRLALSSMYSLPVELEEES
jgi:hypothetical protein